MNNNTDWTGGVASTLPDDAFAGTLVGRVWLPQVDGPSVVAIREDGVFDLSARFSTMREVVEADDPADAVTSTRGDRVGSLDTILDNTPPERRDPRAPWLLSPVDLQVVKATGVSFATSMIERVIEERARGDADSAIAIREEITGQIGADFTTLIPGSEEARDLKNFLIDRGLWSQYLEVGIGPDAEIFTKCPVLASVGTADEVGVLSSSQWNNPEPEVVLAISSRGRIVGASLGNDVNLRDVEGRSALLLGKAKDNNASAAIGPFVRLFDDGFDLDDVRESTVSLSIVGDDGYSLSGSSDMSLISRDPEDLVRQLMGAHHQYPDGAVLYLGTMFAPIDDRGEPGKGFTHHIGDVVTISTPRLGGLVNRVQASDKCAPWEFGIASLMRNLVSRSLL